MKEQSWQQINATLSELLESPASFRHEKLAAMPLAPELKLHIADLLDAGSEADELLEKPLLALQPLGLERFLGQRFGVWRLVSVIGSGGMGAVFLAQRDDAQFSMRAAVKLMSAGAISASAERRFLEERQILAKLDHANIARLIDGGIHSDGTPYLVMEFVEGANLVTWCTQHKLPIADRIALFQQVCAAVHFAHQNLIVHCDLKPANILVTQDGQVKLLDFGIARMMENPSDDPATLAQRMTLDYASPEQVRGTPLTTASDIYSLGVILHELITGRRPHELRGKPLDEVLNLLSTDHTNPKSGSRDIDAIVSKALRPSVAERYPSAAEFSADLERYRRGLPIEARPPTFGYLLSRFAARHKFGVGALASLFLLTITAAAIIQHQSNVATRRFNSVRKLASFLTFEMHDSIVSLPGSTPARKLLVSQGLRYLDELASEAPSDPALRLEIATAYRRLGDVSGLSAEANLGDPAGALRSYAKATKLLESLNPSGSGNPDVISQYAKVLSNTVSVQTDRDPKAAFRTAQALLDFESSLPVDHRSSNRLAIAYQGRSEAATKLGLLDQASKDGDAALKIWESLLAADPKNSVFQRNVAIGHKYAAGRLLSRHQEPEDIELHLKRAEELDSALVAAHPGDREARLDLSFDLSQDAFFQWKTRKQLDLAESTFQRALAVRLELARTDPKDARLQERIRYLHSVLAGVDFELGKFDQAASYCAALLAYDRASESRHSRLAEDLLLSAKIHRAKSQASAACRDLLEAKRLAPSDPEVLSGIRDGMKACPH